MAEETIDFDIKQLEKIAEEFIGTSFGELLASPTPDSDSDSAAAAAATTAEAETAVPVAAAAATEPADAEPADSVAAVPATEPADSEPAVPVSLLSLVSPTAPSSFRVPELVPKSGKTDYLGGIEEPWMVTHDIREHILAEFDDLCRQFIDASVEVWPRCPVLTSWKDAFYAGVTEVPDTIAIEFREQYQRRKFVHEVIAMWHAALSEFYASIAEQSDEEILMAIDSDSEITQRIVAPLIAVDVKGKYTAAHASIKETVKLYLQQLCQYSNMYMLCVKFPDKTMQNIFSMAKTMESKLKRGEMSLSDFNLGSLRDIGKSIVGGMNKSSVEKLTRDLTSGGGIENMIMMMGSMVNQMSGGAVRSDGLTEMLRGMK
jgi:hypothetical protein